MHAATDDTTDLPAERSSLGTERCPARRHRSPERLSLGAVMLLSALLNFIALGSEGYANTYYAAAVKSMLTGWHNFFFVAFDPGGFVSVDKPPRGQ